MQMYLSQYKDLMRVLAADNKPEFWIPHQLFQVQNVADAVRGREWSELNKKIFAITPPYEKMWMEFSNRHWIVTNSDFKAFGTFVIRDTKEDGSLEVRMLIFAHTLYGATDIGGVAFYADSNGELESWKTLYDSRLGKDASDEDKLQFHHVLFRIASVFLVSISFMHIKNIVLDSVPVVPKVRESRQKRGLPDVIFKTLRIEPMQKRMQRQYEENPNGPNSLDLLLHSVRGHYKDFREKGLFGKEHLRGIYWWDAHIRGDADNGIIVKDYEIGAVT